jgi:hypothetical protein
MADIPGHTEASRPESFAPSSPTGATVSRRRTPGRPDAITRHTNPIRAGRPSTRRYPVGLEPVGGQVDEKSLATSGGLQIGENREHHQHPEAPPDEPAENVALLADHPDRGGRDSEILRRQRLAQHTRQGVGRRHQDGYEPGVVAVLGCSRPNSEFDEVSAPMMAPPIQPIRCWSSSHTGGEHDLRDWLRPQSFRCTGGDRKDDGVGAADVGRQGVDHRLESW